MPNYRLSTKAKTDVKDIFNFSTRKFGRQRAQLYWHGIEKQLRFLVDHPELGRRRPDIEADVRSLAYKSHVILYEVHNSNIFVLRILDGAQEPGPNIFG